MTTPALRTVTATLDRNPSFSLKAQLQRSLLVAEIEEAKAKLPTLQAQEKEAKSLLIAAIGILAYAAERAKYKLETGAWGGIVDSELADASANALDAIIAHDAMLCGLAYHEAQIADKESDLNDVALWMEV